MKKNKKGISPLIATVLVIGFTIVLAALVITWGTRLFKTTVEETEAESKFTLACTTGLKVEVVRSNLEDGGTFAFTLRNSNQQRDIEDFFAVLNFEGGASERSEVTSTSPAASEEMEEILGEVEEPASDNTLGFGVPKRYVVLVPEGETLESVDLFPQFTIDGDTRNCENSIRVNV